MNIRFSKDWLRDRIYACWIGKNIGGTLGGPYEGKKEIHDIQGFSTKPGEPLPNDDLDLQLVWLRAVDELGPNAVNSKTLGEYWLTFVTPHWNEYGICKANMQRGFLPPLSGEIFNEQWKHSNGAWIRTEVWACLFPGNVEKAIRYAFEDAGVDHGFGEGTYAAMFIAAMQSAAFVVSDVWTLLEIGLSKIPEDCRVARSVHIVIHAYREGADWKTARTRLVEDSADLGWFQAPANIGFVVMGLLYGEGDFKQSLITAVNCGDDTDCTAATLGALLGIMHGTAGIPGDWREYIGDDIKISCLLYGWAHARFPKTCTDLTDCVLNLLPVTMRTENERLMQTKAADYELTDHNDFSQVQPSMYMGRAFLDSVAGRLPYSFTAENLFLTALVEFYDKPVMEVHGTLKGRITLLPHTLTGQKHHSLRWILPEGWSVQSRSLLFTNLSYLSHNGHNITEFTLTADENVSPVNTVVIEITSTARPTKLYVPLNIIS